MIKDKNNNDWDINGLNISFDNNIPTNKLFEKSGEGKNKNPNTLTNFFFEKICFDNKPLFVGKQLNIEIIFCR